MKISEIITDKYKLRIPPTVYYELLADVQEAEEEQDPETKNDLGVDCISRDVVKNYIQAHIHEIITESGEDKNKHTNRVLRSMIHGVNCMPSVTPQEPFKPMVEIDLYSVIKQKYIEREVLDEIRAEIERLQKMCDKNDLNLMAQYSAFGMVLDILDKYKAETEDQE